MPGLPQRAPPARTRLLPQLVPLLRGRLGAPAASVDAEAEAEAARRATLLVADDDASVREALQARLTPLGCTRAPRPTPC